MQLDGRNLTVIPGTYREEAMDFINQHQSTWGY